ncbi:hypothetical protein [Polymorphobacter sp.]|uniref:hypothetical protein n=1 Tax=Polymorphobacter sp. TaxID=1909290 RepID=UPI003F6FC32D
MSAPKPHPEDSVHCRTCGKRQVGEKARLRFREWPRNCQEPKGCSLTLRYAGAGQKP